MDKQKYNLLIIDDNEVIRATFQKYFSKKEYNVVTASDGLEGLQMLESEKETFDLVVTDIVMPKISGVGIIVLVKKRFPNLPIIAITGYGEHPELLAEEAQADIVLEKPVNFQKLEKLISGLINKK